MHGTSAALGDAAAEFGAGHAEHVAQHPEQRHVVRRAERLVFAVNLSVGTASLPYGVAARIYRTNFPFGAGTQNYKRGRQLLLFTF
jgi:hypothetical protein